jgi:hypothetical protein
MAYQPFEAIKQKRLFGVEGMASMKKEEARRDEHSPNQV